MRLYIDGVKLDYDIIIVGAGLVGLSAALACANKGASIALIDAVHPKFAKADGRASAIAASSLNMLNALGVADKIGSELQPISDMLISDGGVGNVSPLVLHFDSQEVGGPTGYMVENNILRKALLSVVEAQDKVTLFAPFDLISAERSSGAVTVSLSGGQNLKGSLLVAADGRHSALRKSAGIEVSKHDYAQKALVTTFRHELPHDGVAHQIFFPGGPLALLPLTHKRMSIVWSDKAAAIDAALAIDEGAFIAELRRRTGDFLGEMILSAPRQAFPLSLQMAESYTDARLALIGDAAHAIHPLAGQGLNMGLRDAAALADVTASARATGLDIGGANLGEYEAWRNFDNRALAMSTDIFNGLFSNKITPLRHVRRLGLAGVNRSDLVKSFFMKEASGKMGELPSLLRSD